MISRPTTQQLISAVCAELSAKVAPAVTDPVVSIQLEMALAVLHTAAARSGSELAWMAEERVAVEAAARSMLEDLPNATELRDALQAYDDGLTNSLYLDDAQADYARASEVLSRMAEVAFEAGSPDHVATVLALMDQRHANQQAVTGQFVAAGRT